MFSQCRLKQLLALFHRPITKLPATLVKLLQMLLVLPPVPTNVIAAFGVRMLVMPFAYHLPELPPSKLVTLVPLPVMAKVGWLASGNDIVAASAAVPVMFSMPILLEIIID